MLRILNKFCPNKVEVNEATVEEVIDFMKKSDAKMSEAIDLYKAWGDDVFYGPEEQPLYKVQHQEK